MERKSKNAPFKLKSAMKFFGRGRKGRAGYQFRSGRMGRMIASIMQGRGGRMQGS
tara:strand:- start:162 stop:326 length:165 start_codon:yes stop_codon:yes gene_type:complete